MNHLPALGFGLVVTSWLGYVLCAGRIPSMYGWIERRKEPRAYWLIIVLMAALAAFALVRLLA
jgi:hypothetical protein